MMRDYKKEPIKFGENILYKDLYEIYINQNTSMQETCQFFGISKDILRRNLKIYNLHKSTDQAKELRNKTNLERYGVINPFMDKERVKQGVQKKYGVDNPAHLESVLNKRKETCKKKYGGTCPFNSNKIKKKIKKINNQKYGGNSPQCSAEIREKSKRTCLEKYGVDNISQLKETKEKVKQTTLEHHGVENISQVEKIKQQKIDTFISHYGVKHPMQLKDYRDSCFEKAKKNGSLCVSKFEKQVHNLLFQKFSKVIKEYNKDKRYPFRCDFYIPEIDLFIELQGYQGHGKHPFNEQSSEDLKLLDYWKSKAKQYSYKKDKNQYEKYIKIWTISDPLKRKIAKENNLNWLEFFSLNEFMNWYNNLS